MSAKRRDKKGRVLRAGEAQRSNGMYVYRYTDLSGKRRSVYSWLLVNTDRAPVGKHGGPALRDLESEIQKCLDDGISIYAASTVTLNEIFENYIKSKLGLKLSTRVTYTRNYDTSVRDTVGNLVLDKIKPQHIRKLYVDLITKQSYAKATLKIVDTVIRGPLQMAVQDGLIRVNPAEGVLTDVTSGLDMMPAEREALTAEEQERFVKYVKETSVYSDLLNFIIVLLGTGIRFGEAAGLTWSDCDFVNDVISIRRNLVVTMVDGKLTKYISPPKSRAGNRTIPMIPEVKRALLDEKKRQLLRGGCKENVDGVSNFVFTNKRGTVFTRDCIHGRFRHIVDSHNKKEITLAEQESREPMLLPEIYPHLLRHTFCTRFCGIEGNTKIVQGIMGHASFSTTQIYNTVSASQVSESMNRLSNVINFG